MGLCWPKKNMLDDSKDKLLSDYDTGIFHCILCNLEIKNKKYILHCGHHYHPKCIFDHFNGIGKTYGYPQCPICGKIHLQSFEYFNKLQKLVY
jgi:hypothetical protein